MSDLHTKIINKGYDVRVEDATFLKAQGVYSTVPVPEDLETRQVHEIEAATGV